MYGYIKKDTYEMKYKDILLYKNLYCSICNNLKNNIGTLYRLFTSYDATFLLAIFDGIEKSRDEIILKCPFHPFKKIRFSVSKEALDYVTYISIYYAITKLQDNYIDEGKTRYRFLKNHICKNKKVKVLLSKYQDTTNKLKIILEQYYLMERSPENFGFDELTNQMGHLFGTVFSEYKSSFDMELKQKMYSFGFSIGKWIYITDAFDDLKEDRVNNKFNPLFHMREYSKELSDKYICEKITFLNDVILRKMLSNYSSIIFLRNTDVISNIINYGMRNSINKIKSTKYTINRKEDKNV